MKTVFLLVALGSVVLNCKAHAFSPNIEVDPKRLNDLPVVFDIHSKRLPNGDVEFTVIITERGDFLKIGDNAGADLETFAATHIVKEADNSIPVINRDFHMIRELKCDRRGTSVNCVFSVTEKELEIPDLKFGFRWGIIQGPYVYSFFAKVKNFMPK